jgi:hypothetical protein
VYGITSRSIEMPPAVSDESGIDDDTVLTEFMMFLRDGLKGGKGTSSVSKSELIKKFSTMTALQQKWCYRVVLKNLRCGVKESLIEKIWSGTVTHFRVALADTLKCVFTPKDGMKILEPVSYPVHVEHKLDGLRTVFIKDEKGTVTVYKRSGKMCTHTLPTLVKALEQSDIGPIVLDGECKGDDWNESQSVIASTKTKKDDSNMKLHVFDVLCLEDWNRHVNGTPFSSRLQVRAGIVAQINSPNIIDVAGKTVNNESELLEFYSQSLEQGHEGVMLKDLSMSYEFDRSRAILKMKPFVDYDGIVVGTYQGREQTKNAGRLGGLIVLLQNGITTRVGGGINDATRELFEKMGSNIIGTIVVIKGQPDPLTSDGLTKDGRIRFPDFMRSREVSDTDGKLLSTHSAWNELNTIKAS